MGFALLSPSYRPHSRGRHWHPGAKQRLLLPPGEYRFVEILDQLVKQAVPVDLRLQVQEHRSEPDRRPVHEDKGARRRDAAETAQVAMYVVDQALPVRARFGALLDHAGAIIKQRAVDKACPA